MKKSIVKFVIDIFNDKLVSLFDKFKVSSPKIALVIYALIGGVVKGADLILATPEAHSILGSYAEPLNTVIMALGLLFTALTGAHTVGSKRPTGDILIPSTTPVFPLPELSVKPQKGSIEDILKSDAIGITKYEQLKKELTYTGGNTTAHTLGNTGLGGSALIAGVDPVKKKKHKYHPTKDVKKDTTGNIA
jgi:hypothetical protein